MRCARGMGENGRFALDVVVSVASGEVGGHVVAWEGGTTRGREGRAVMKLEMGVSLTLR